MNRLRKLVLVSAISASILSAPSHAITDENYRRIVHGAVGATAWVSVSVANAVATKYISLSPNGAFWGSIFASGCGGYAYYASKYWSPPSDALHAHALMLTATKAVVVNGAANICGWGASALLSAREGFYNLAAARASGAQNNSNFKSASNSVEIESYWVDVELNELKKWNDQIALGSREYKLLACAAQSRPSLGCQAARNRIDNGIARYKVHYEYYINNTKKLGGAIDAWNRTIGHI